MFFANQSGCEFPQNQVLFRGHLAHLRRFSSEVRAGWSMLEHSRTGSRYIEPRVISAKFLTPKTSQNRLNHDNLMFIEVLYKSIDKPFCYRFVNHTIQVKSFEAMFVLASLRRLFQSAVHFQGLAALRERTGVVTVAGCCGKSSMTIKQLHGKLENHQF